MANRPRLLSRLSWVRKESGQHKYGKNPAKTLDALGTPGISTTEWVIHPGSHPDPCTPPECSSRLRELHSHLPRSNHHLLLTNQNSAGFCGIKVVCCESIKLYQVKSNLKYHYHKYRLSQADIHNNYEPDI